MNIAMQETIVDEMRKTTQMPETNTAQFGFEDASLFLKF